MKTTMRKEVAEALELLGHTWKDRARMAWLTGSVIGVMAVEHVPFWAGAALTANLVLAVVEARKIRWTDDGNL